ncbi:hypothetical protein C4K14_3657 [Pseudomonas chlororaphis subsp. aureofaciens]|nr:hypothetical protein C4K14_3657 [Pseudomonas chlororaphis subsp. aureofaciens]
MLLKKKNLVTALTCVLMLAAAPLLPVTSAYAKDGGGHGGGNGGGNGGVMAVAIVAAMVVVTVARQAATPEGSAARAIAAA